MSNDFVFCCVGLVFSWKWKCVCFHLDMADGNTSFSVHVYIEFGGEAIAVHTQRERFVVVVVAFLQFL